MNRNIGFWTVLFCVLRKVGECVLPVRAVLAVQDEQYIEPFLQYVHCSEFDRRIMVTAFSRKDAFVKYMEHSSDSVDVVLGEALFFEAWENWNERVVRIQLGALGDEKCGDHVLSKYQPLQHLLTNVQNIVRGNKGDIRQTNGNTKIIAVYSIVGGCGKTTVALNLVRQLAADGGNVFYLNLETVMSSLGCESRNARTGSGTDSSGTGLARLLYDLKAAEDRKESIQPPVSTYAYRDSELQGDSFYLLDNLDELLEMDVKDTGRLLEYIANSGSYDVIVVDVDSCPNDRTDAVLARADRIIWLITENADVLSKTETWLNYLERSHHSEYCILVEKALFVMNRYSGEMSGYISKKEMKIEAALPYIPAWNKGASRDAILQSPIYQRDVHKLCLTLHGEAEKEQHL
ncbi:CobQ/CobB/MinD/ParA nucleotide binding domain protein [compost metagenome]